MAVHQDAAKVEAMIKERPSILYANVLSGIYAVINHVVRCHLLLKLLPHDWVPGYNYRADQIIAK